MTTIRKPSLKELIDSNPSIDPKQLRQFRKSLRKLREAGLSRKEYDLASPISRRRATLTDIERLDPRTIHLGAKH